LLLVYCHFSFRLVFRQHRKNWCWARMETDWESWEIDGSKQRLTDRYHDLETPRRLITPGQPPGSRKIELGCVDVNIQLARIFSKRGHLGEIPGVPIFPISTHPYAQAYFLNSCLMFLAKRIGIPEGARKRIQSCTCKRLNFKIMQFFYLSSFCREMKH